MRRTKEICRLFTAGLTGRAIARSLGASSSTVGDAITRLKAAGLTWEDVEPLSEPELERRLYREQGRTAPDPRVPGTVGQGHVIQSLDESLAAVMPSRDDDVSDGGLHARETHSGFDRSRCSDSSLCMQLRTIQRGLPIL